MKNYSYQIDVTLNCKDFTQRNISQNGMISSIYKKEPCDQLFLEKIIKLKGC